MAQRIKVEERIKRPLLYSLFELTDGKWKRISFMAYSKTTAIKLYQNSLLAYSLYGVGNERRLKPVGHSLSKLRSL